MWPDRVSNPGPLIYESGALPTALCSPAAVCILKENIVTISFCNRITVKTLNIGTPRPATIAALNIKPFNFTMK